MSKRSIPREIFFSLQPKAVLLVAILISALALSSSASAIDRDLSGWRFFRDIRLSQNHPDGLVGVALDSAFLENCQPDLKDLRLISSDGASVPFALTDASAGIEINPFPVRITNVVRAPGKGTEIWIDKTAKVLSRGTLIQTTSKGFLRKVEIRGSDTGRDWYIIRMDGLIADLTSPIPVSSLLVSHPVNNFQYLNIKILDDDQPPLKISGVLCNPPASPNSEATRSLDTRILENRSDPDGPTTTIVADLGEKRFPLVSVTITTPAAEFVKKVRFRGGSSPSPESWKTIFEGAFFRMRKDETWTENVTATMKPHTGRYFMLELYGGSATGIPVEKVSATGGIPVLIFNCRRDLAYRLYYDNPAASAAPRATDLSTADPAQTDSLCKDTDLGPPQKNALHTAAGPMPALPKGNDLSLRRIAGIALLLIGLLVLFSILLKRRSSYYTDRGRNERFTRSRI